MDLKRDQNFEHKRTTECEKGNFLIFYAAAAMKTILVDNKGNFFLIFPLHHSNWPAPDFISNPPPKDLVDHIPCNLPTYPDCMHLHTTHFIPEDGGSILL
jgi:hypothetical protein